jgi:phage terminase small subunit
MRGRKPTPTALRKLRGNTNKKPLPRGEPEPVGNISDAPDWLTPSQREGWDWALRHSPPGLLRQLDRGALMAWVVAEDLHRQATIQQAKVGLLVKAPVTGALMQSPFLPIINRQALIMLRAASELGFSPVSRPRIAERAGSLPVQPADVPMTVPKAGRRKGGAQEVVVSIEEFLRNAPTG